MPTPLGRLACQRNPLLFELETAVESCDPVADGSTFRVILANTVLFPTGGGQPNDVGKIASASKIVNVLDAFRVAGQAVHLTDGRLEPGTPVRVEIDPIRRVDHMQQHTGQHLLSAIAFKEFGWDTVGWNLAPSGRCAVEFSASPSSSPLDTENLSRLEQLTNEAIKSNRTVSVEESITDTSLFRSREGTETTSAEPDSEKGLLRYIRIDRHDINPCCGTHVPYLGMLQVVKLLGTENSARNDKKKGKSANVRVFFVVGNRALEHYGSLVKISKDLSGLTGGSTEANLVPAVQRVNDTLKATQKELARLRTDHVSSKITDLKPLLDSESLILYIPPHDPNPTAASLAAETITAFSNALRPLPVPNSVIVLSTFPETAIATDVPLILVGNERVASLAAFLAEKAGEKIKGNAIPAKDGWTRHQGKVSGVKKKEMEGWLVEWATEGGLEIKRL